MVRLHLLGDLFGRDLGDVEVTYYWRDCMQALRVFLSILAYGSIFILFFYLVGILLGEVIW